MNIKQLQNMIYSSAKQYIVNHSINFAMDFNESVKTIFNRYESNNREQMTNELTKYFISIGAIDIVRNNFADFRYNEQLDKQLQQTIKNISKIDSLTETQIYIIICIKNGQIVTEKDIMDLNIFDIDTDINNINVNDFIQTFNSIISNEDISSILNFIQINGLQYAYKAQLQAEKEPIMLFKFIYDIINNSAIEKHLKNNAMSDAFYKLASSKDDEQLKQNCQFLSEDKIEFPVKEDSSKILKNFAAYTFDIQLNNKKYANVQQVINAIIGEPDDFIINLKDEEVKELKDKLLDALKEATKGLDAELGFPDPIKGDEYSAEQLLNWVLNKTVDKRYIDLIEILFTDDDVNNLYKNTGIYEDETLYEGIYYDFKSVFDEDIKPPFDTGYKMADIDTFWKAAVKLEKDLIENEGDIKKCFKEFGQIAFSCNDYMITIKILFTILNNVKEDRIYMCLLYVTIVMTDNIFGKVWNAVKSTGQKAVNTVKSIFASQIYFRDREYVYPINALNERGSYSGYSLKQALDKIKTDFKDYSKEHKDETMKDYVVSIYKNLDQYIQTSTDPSVNAEYTQETPSEEVVQLTQQIDQYVSTITTNTEEVAKQLAAESVMVNNGQLTLEQYNFLNN